MGRLVLKHTNLKQSCSKSRTLSLIYKRRLLGSNRNPAKTVSSTVQAGTQCLARLVFQGVEGERRRVVSHRRRQACSGRACRRRPLRRRASDLTASGVRDLRQ
jgi:hypothetical protein